MKFIPVFIVGFLLMFSGGLASRVFFHKFVEPDLLKQSQRILRDSSVDRNSEEYEHFFVSLSGPVTKGQVFRIKQVDNQIWAALKPPEGSPVREEFLGSAQFTARINSENVVVLEGDVPNEFVKKDLVRAAEKAIGINGVEDRLVVVANVTASGWGKEGPEFLTRFLSFSGVESFTVDGEGLRLEGEVLSREVREKLGEEATRLVELPLVVSNELSVKAPRTPALEIESTPEGFEISGLLPDEKSRESLLETVRRTFPDRELKDEDIKIAGGVAQPWWLKNAEIFIPKFFKATNGSGHIRYWKNRLHLDGMVSSESAIDELAKVPQVKGKPDDFSISHQLSVRPDTDAEITIGKDKDGRILLEGKVADSAVKDPILVAFINEDPDIVILDKIKVSDEIKEANWGDCGELATRILFETEGGALKLSSTAIELTGQSSNEEQKAELGEAAAKVAGSSGVVENRLTVPEVEEPETPVLDAKDVDFSEHAIYFTSGRASVSSSQKPKVDEIVKIMEQLGEDTRFIVGGYADYLGNKSVNRELSLARANSVRDELVKKGISKDRLTVKFHGEDTTHTRRSNLWKSRRVELSIAE